MHLCCSRLPSEERSKYAWACTVTDLDHEVSQMYEEELSFSLRLQILILWVHVDASRTC
jgi:hypothetical protein